MNCKTLTQWSTICGVVGIILYVIAFVMLWQGSALLMDRFDRKDLYFAGSGLLYIAIWLKLSAVCCKCESK